MKIIITIDIDDEFADPDHETGVTTAGFDKIYDALAEVAHSIDIEKQEE